MVRFSRNNRKTRTIQLAIEGLDVRVMPSTVHPLVHLHHHAHVAPHHHTTHAPRGGGAGFGRSFGSHNGSNGGANTGGQNGSPLATCPLRGGLGRPALSRRWPFTGIFNSTGLGWKAARRCALPHPTSPAIRAWASALTCPGRPMRPCL